MPLRKLKLTTSKVKCRADYHYKMSHVLTDTLFKYHDVEERDNAVIALLKSKFTKVGDKFKNKDIEVTDMEIFLKGCGISLVDAAYVFRLQYNETNNLARRSNTVDYYDELRRQLADHLAINYKVAFIRTRGENCSSAVDFLLWASFQVYIFVSCIFFLLILFFEKHVFYKY